MLEQGFSLQGRVLSASVMSELTAVITKHQQRYKTTSIRHADLKIPAIKTFAQSALITGIASQYIVGPPQLVRAIMFDKNREENWRVGATL